jgi:hypothetical protein
MNGCTRLIESFHVSTTAGLYSTVAGVMSGFAFFSLAALISRGPRASTTDAANARYDLAAQALSAAFLALLLSCITWAVLAGEDVTGGRASTVEVFAGCGFVLAAVQLFYSILLLIDAQEASSVQLRRFFQMSGGAFLCPFTFLLSLLGVSDYRETAPGPDGRLVFSVASALAVILIVIVVRELWNFRRRPNVKPRGPFLPFWLNPSYVTVGIGALSLLGTSAIGVALSQCDAAGPVVVLLPVAATALALANQSRRFLYPPSEFSRSVETQEQGGPVGVDS